LTPEHQNQRLHSLEEFDRTWFDMLHEEKIKRDGGFVSTEGLLNHLMRKLLILGFFLPLMAWASQQLPYTAFGWTIRTLMQQIG